MANNFTSIGTTALLILNKLRCDAQIRELQAGETKNGEGEPKKGSDDTDKENDEKERRAIERRIRDILAMENRLRRNRI